MNHRKILFLAFLLLSSAIICADTIILKNGGKISVSQWWYEDDELKYYGYGGVYGISVGDVALIMDESPQQTEAARDPLTEQRSHDDPSLPEKEFQQLEQKVTDLEAISLHASVDEKDKIKLKIAEAYTKIGNGFYARRNYDSALTYYRRALDIRPDFLPPKINIASTLLATGNYRDPLPYILEALSQNPDDATLHEVLGEIYYMMDNMEEALKEWERSLRLEKNDNLQMRLEKARKEMKIAQDYQVSNASHFTLIFDGEKYSRLGDDALSFLEENFDELVYRFSHYPPLPFSIIIYPESDFYEITESPKWVGGLFDGKIRIPVGGLESLTPRAKRMLLHELAHAFIHSKTKGNCPKWLHEGIAQIIEGKSAPLNVIASDRFEKWDLSSLNRDLDYGASLSLVSYIEQTYSFHSIILILEELGRGKDIETALEKATGLAGVSLIQEWKSAMIAKGSL